MSHPIEATPPCVLTIGGLDPSGGAGLAADARAVSAFGAHACGITTAVIAQNTQGVARVEAVSLAMLDAQLNNLLEDINPRAIKIGMLPDIQGARIVAQCVEALNLPIIIDTVFAPSHGPRFSNRVTIEFIASYLLPRCALATPNILEAQALCSFTIDDKEDMIAAARLIQQRYGAKRVLIKGGHLPCSDGDRALALDILLEGECVHEFSAPRVHGTEVRGTGCLLASAIAAQCAQDVPMPAAVRIAKSWLTQKIAGAAAIGKGRRVTV